MSAMSDSLVVVDPHELVPRRRFDRLSDQDRKALQAEIRFATENLPRLRLEFYARNPEMTS